MVECNSIEASNRYPKLNDQQQFKLYKINEFKNYFVAEIQEKKLMNKLSSKYITSFDYYCNFNFYRNCDKTIKNNTK